MPPPLQQPSASSAPSKSTQKKGSEFVCKIRYKNPLPALPFAPKLLSYAVDEHKYAQLSTVLGGSGGGGGALWLRKMPWPLWTDADLGMPVDLVDLEKYSLQEDNEPVSDADLPLLQPPEDLSVVAHPSTSSTSNTSAAMAEGTTTTTRHRPMVPWLRRTEYISSEGSKMGRMNGPALEQLRMQQQRDAHATLFARSREHQLEAIERSFEASKEIRLSSLKHPRDPSLKAVQAWPVFPDENLASRVFVHCYFDNDPAVKPMFKPRSAWSEKERQERQQVDQQLSHGILKATGIATETSSGKEGTQQWFGLYLPNLQQQDGDSPSLPLGDATTPLNLHLIRHYHFRPDKKQDSEKFLFWMHDDCVTYHPLPRRAHLQKKRSSKKKRTQIGGGIGGIGGGIGGGGSTSEEEQQPEYATVLKVKRLRTSSGGSSGSSA